MSNSSEESVSDRRRVLRRFLGLAASAGVTGLLLDRLTGKSVLPNVQAETPMDIDTANTGAATTSLSSPGNPALTATNTSNGAALQGTCTAGTGILGTTTSGTGVQGTAGAGGTALAGFAGDPSAIPIVAQGSTGQTANLQEWHGSSGTLNVVAANGWLGIGTTAPEGEIHVGGAATADIFCGLGPHPATGPAMNYGYSGSSFGEGSGFFNVRPDASAVAPNPSLRFMTTNVQRMIITNTGNVGIGTTNPGAPLEVDGAETIGAHGIVDLVDTTAYAAGVGGAINFKGYYQTGTLASFGVIRGYKLNSTSGDFQGGLAFYTLPSTGTFGQQMTITPTGYVGIGTTSPNTTFQVAGGLSVKVVTKTSAYTMTGSDYMVLANAASSAFTVTLPPASNAGQMVVIVKTDSSANTVTVSGAGTDTIQGATTQALSTQYKKLNLISGDTGVWYDVGTQLA